MVCSAIHDGAMKHNAGFYQPKHIIALEPDVLPGTLRSWYVSGLKIGTPYGSRGNRVFFAPDIACFRWLVASAKTSWKQGGFLSLTSAIEITNEMSELYAISPHTAKPKEFFAWVGLNGQFRVSTTPPPNAEYIFINIEKWILDTEAKLAALPAPIERRVGHSRTPRATVRHAIERS